jgi:phage shock protein PspC (stress-responsive transcriptional regulator)
MKKTQTINLGGIIFHINVDAYGQLYAYLTSVKNQFTDMAGQDDIIADIEARIAEILNEKKVQIITGKHVDGVIAIMGKPEQYGEEDPESESEPITKPEKKAKGVPKRIYRHPDDKIIGGVCGGLGTLVHIDPVIFRILFMVTAFFGGFGALIYLVMWAIVPMAQSTADRLKMSGETITTDSIVKTITAQMDKSLEPRHGNNVLKKFFSFIGDVFESIFNILKKIFKALGVIFRPVVGILFLIFGLVATLSVFFFRFNARSFSYIIDSTFGALPIVQYFIYATLALFLIIPIFQIIYFGLRLLFRMGRQPAFIKGLLTSAWIISLIALIIFGVFGSTRFSADGFTQRNVPLSKITADTVKVSLWENDYFMWTDRRDHVVKSDDGDFLVSDVNLDIKRSDDNRFYLIVRHEASGGTSKAARSVVDKIGYNYLPSSDGLLLKNYLEIRDNAPFSFQKTDLTLLVPNGKSVYLDETIKYMLYDVENVTNTWDRKMVDHVWKMKKEGLTCTDCD